jgi:nicotinate-nucleotide adenylyltransferase
VRVAIYGGSFNPPHVGHALVAAWLRWTGQADEVWLVPAYHHAFDKVLAPWDLRLRMTQALADTLGPWARVLPIEGELPVPSFTVHTLEALASRHPEHELALVVGADVLPQLPLWKEGMRLRERFPLIVVGRQGYPAVEGAPSFPDISSTDIRARVARSAPIGHLVPERVRVLLEQEGVEAYRSAVAVSQR